MDSSTLQQLKIILQGFGPVSPLAWETIKPCIAEVHLRAHQNLIRDMGSLAWVVSGNLKEYDPWQRTKPSIVNFISTQQFIVTRKHNLRHFVRAYTNCLVYQVTRQQLHNLYHAFNELEQVHDGICETYDEAIGYGRLLRDTLTGQNRVNAFKAHFGKHLNQMAKRDMANYLHMEYSYFLKLYNAGG